MCLKTASEPLRSFSPARRFLSGRWLMPVVRGKDIEVLFSASAIARRNLELAKEIAGRDYHDLLVISILKGSFVFAADLIRAMHDVGLSPEVEFIFISSYGAGTTSGE